MGYDVQYMMDKEITKKEARSKKEEGEVLETGEIVSLYKIEDDRVLLEVNSKSTCYFYGEPSEILENIDSYVNKNISRERMKELREEKGEQTEN